MVRPAQGYSFDDSPTWSSRDLAIGIILVRIANLINGEVLGRPIGAGVAGAPTRSVDRLRPSASPF